MNILLKVILLSSVVEKQYLIYLLDKNKQG